MKKIFQFSSQNDLRLIFQKGIEGKNIKIQKEKDIQEYKEIQAEKGPLLKEVEVVQEKKQKWMGIAEKNPKEAFKQFEKYSYEEWAKEVLLTAVKSDPWWAFKYKEKYQGTLWGFEILDAAKQEDVLLQATEKNFFPAFKFLKEYIGQPWAKNILFKAAELGSEEAFKFLEEYDDQPWAKEVLLIAVKNNPSIVKLNSNIDKYYEKKDWVKDIINMAVQTDIKVLDGLCRNAVITTKLPWVQELWCTNNIQLVKDVNNIYQWDDEIYDSVSVTKNISKVENVIKKLNKTETKQLAQFKVVLQPLGKNKIILEKGYKEQYKEDAQIIVIDCEKSEDEIRREIQKRLFDFNMIKSVTGQNQDPNLLSFLSDPALSKFSQEDIPGSEMRTDRQNRELHLMIKRNLYIQGKKENETNVQQEFVRLQEIQKKYEKISLFAKRNVLFVANNEKVGESGAYGPNEGYEEWEIVKENVKNRGGDSNRFGTREAREFIKKQSQNYAFIRPERGNEYSLRQMKEKIKQQIQETPPPFTFVFDGHGHPDCLVLEAYTSTTNILTVEEIAKSMIQRYKNFPQLKNAKPEEQDIYVFGACFSANFQRDLYKTMQKKIETKVVFPITLSMVEYGQYGFTTYDDKYGNKLFSKVMNFENGEQTTIGTVMKNEHLNNSNPCLFVPLGKKNIQQISEKKDDMEGESEKIEELRV